MDNGALVNGLFAPYAVKYGRRFNIRKHPFGRGAGYGKHAEGHILQNLDKYSAKAHHDYRAELVVNFCAYDYLDPLVGHWGNKAPLNVSFRIIIFHV